MQIGSAKTTTDLKHALRKLEFPASAKEVLPRIESIILNRGKQNLLMQLIAEFIFLEHDTRKGGGGNQSQPYGASQMTPFKEFQLILVLIEFFSQPSPDSTRNAVFLSLFGSNPTPQRSKVLCHLISTAISGSVAPLLSSAGAWMQQAGCTNAPSLEVARTLVNDFIKFSKKISEHLKQLPLVAPNFAANVMSAVAELYMNDKPGQPLTPPPDGLLDVFTEWVTENPGLCLASQQSPAGIVISMPVTTPVAGLIRWTVLAPLVPVTNAAYSELLLSLLQTLLDVVNTGPPTVINAQHLMQICAHLKANSARKSTTENSYPIDNDAAYEKSMERFAQAIEVGISRKCIFGNIPQLISKLQKLPPHPLMTIVINANKP